MDLSIIIPVYNEIGTLAKLLKLVSEIPISKELIIVDDGSTDGTTEFLEKYRSDANIPVTTLFHDKNKGKGKAIRTALPFARGEFTVIQDGDLEYNPYDFIPMLESGKASGSVIYGSRNLRQNKRSSRRFYHGGRFLSELVSFLYSATITDESTCYKMFPTRIIRDIPLNCERFEFCPEITAKLLQNKIRILEVPISYTPRIHGEGKKIRWTDGFFAIWMLLKLKLLVILEIIHLPWEKQPVD